MSFSLLSTDRYAIDQQGESCDYKQMVDSAAPNPSDVGEKLDHIKERCGIGSDADLAVALGLKSAQVVSNWRKRNRWTDEAMTRIPQRTGASVDWMRGYSGNAFPNGVKLKIAAPPEKRVQRLEADIDQARNALYALFDVLNRKLPELKLAAAYDEALAAVAPSEAYAEKGFHGLLSTFVHALAESAAAAPAPARSGAARLPSAKKGAK
jgi:hypothetical protein